MKLSLQTTKQIPAWQAELANKLHRACVSVQTRLNHGERKRNAFLRVAKYHNGRSFKCDPKHRLSLSEQTLRRAFARWKRGGEVPSAFRFRYQPRRTALTAPILVRFVEYSASQQFPSMKFLHASKSIPARPDAWAIARQRHATLQTFVQLKGRRGGTKAAAMVGASAPTLWRWQKKFAARGLAGLKPKPASGGRRSLFSKVRFPVAAAREIERLIVAAGNRRAAWRQFAGSLLCPPLVARHIIHTGNVPACLDGFGRVSRVEAICYQSADGRRLLVRLPGRGAITTALAVPAGFKLSNPTKIIR